MAAARSEFSFFSACSICVVFTTGSIRRDSSLDRPTEIDWDRPLSLATRLAISLPSRAPAGSLPACWVSSAVLLSEANAAGFENWSSLPVRPLAAICWAWASLWMACSAFLASDAAIWKDYADAVPVVAICWLRFTAAACAASNAGLNPACTSVDSFEKLLDARSRGLLIASAAETNALTSSTGSLSLSYRNDAAFS